MEWTIIQLLPSAFQRSAVPGVQNSTPSGGGVFQQDPEQDQESIPLAVTQYKEHILYTVAQR